MSNSKPTTRLAPRLHKYFKDYSAYHKTSGNKVTHYFGIPFIVVSLLGLLGSLPLAGDGLTGSLYFRLDCGVLLLTLGTICYLFMDWKITIPFCFVLSGLYFLGRALPLPVNWGLFVGGWILQGLGHALYEKKSPAFLKNGTHLLIGPIWIFARLVGYK